MGVGKMAGRESSSAFSAAKRRPAPKRGKQPESALGDIPLAGTGIAPVAGDDDRPRDTDQRSPQDKGDFQKRLAEAVEHTLQEHPDGSAPPLDRLTQDRDPSKDL
jgi:hypothetical protein